MAHGITLLRLVYEELEADLNIALRRLVPSLGLGLRQEQPRDAGLERLGDQISKSWTLRQQCRLLNLS